MKKAEQNKTKNMRGIPAVHELLKLAQKAGAIVDAGNNETRWTRDLLDQTRRDILSGKDFVGTDHLISALSQKSVSVKSQKTVRVLNATGIILHTNLGRSPLPESVLESIRNLNSGYCNLEIDLNTGKRGKRGEYLSTLISEITGAEEAVVVNNGAAGVYLLLSCLCSNAEAIVSRGELVQIGGGFKVPDIMESSGAILREVGTTNITTSADYQKAINDRTSLIMKIHRSNFYLSGHTEDTSTSEIAAVAKENNLISVMDLGSGALTDWPQLKSAEDPTVKEVINSGIDLVIFSGDKLVGGPQAGIIAGNKNLIAKIKKHPLFRTMRAGRLTSVTLQECLSLAISNQFEEFPAYRMANEPLATITERTNAVCSALNEAGVPCKTRTGQSAIGGGTSPSVTIPTTLLVIEEKKSFASKLRKQKLPVICRRDGGDFVFDLRTVEQKDENSLRQSIESAWK